MNALGLGPVIGNRFADERKTQLKPHLMHRLVEQTVRAVPMGTMVTVQDGRLAFVPNYTHETTKAPAKAVPAEGDDERACMTGFDPMTSPLQAGDRIKQVRKHFTNYGSFAEVLSIDGRVMTIKWETNPGGDNGLWKTQGHRDCFEIISRGEADPTRKPS